jgi:hypothetical protein
LSLDRELNQYLNDLEIKRLKQIEHLRSLEKKEQKEYISKMVAHYIYANREHGVEEIPYAWFSKEYNELDNDLLEELFIHAQTIFALYKNGCFPFEHVEIKSFVKYEAKKFGMTKAFGKFFDPNTILDEDFF